MLWWLKSLSCHCPCQPRSLGWAPKRQSRIYFPEPFLALHCVLVQHLLTLHMAGVPSRVALCPRPINGCSLSNYFYFSAVFFLLSWLLPLVL